MLQWLVPRQRVRQPELMDDAGLDQSRHLAALGGLARLNFFSRSDRILWTPIAQLARTGGLRRLRVLDLATGAGDIPLRLWRRSRTSGLTLEIHGVDRSPRAIEFARRRAAAWGAPIDFAVLDVLGTELPEGFDVVMCSLFLHHLDDDQARLLLAKMAGAAGQMVLTSDLVRCSGGLVLAASASRLLTTCDVVRQDAVRSVRAAFTVEEARSLARAAGLEGATVSRRWPFRFLLSWRRR